MTCRTPGRVGPTWGDLVRLGDAPRTMLVVDACAAHGVLCAWTLDGHEVLMWVNPRALVVERKALPTLPPMPP